MNTKIMEQIDAQCADAESFCDSLYEDTFGTAFVDIVQLHSRMKSQRQPITDEELSYILTTLPLELFSISENLNKLRLKLEVTKLENTKREVEFKKECMNSNNSIKSGSVLNQIVKDSLVTSMTEYRIFEACYSSVISRVENELTYARELIMGAKKIWDSRRSAEAASPIGPNSVKTLQPYPM